MTILKSKSALTMGLFSAVLGLGLVTASAQADTSLATQVKRLQKKVNQLAAAVAKPGPRGETGAQGLTGAKGEKGDAGISPSASLVAQQAAALNQPSINQIESRVNLQQTVIDASAAFRNQWITALPDIALYLTSYVSPQVDYLADELRPYMTNTVNPKLSQLDIYLPKPLGKTYINPTGLHANSQADCVVVSFKKRGCLDDTGCRITYTRQNGGGAGSQFPDSTASFDLYDLQVAAPKFNPDQQPVAITGTTTHGNGGVVNQRNFATYNGSVTRFFSDELEFFNGKHSGCNTLGLRPLDPVVDAFDESIVVTGEAFSGVNKDRGLVVMSQFNNARMSVQVSTNQRQ